MTDVNGQQPDTDNNSPISQKIKQYDYESFISKSPKMSSGLPSKDVSRHRQMQINDSWYQKSYHDFTASHSGMPIEAPADDIDEQVV